MWSGGERLVPVDDGCFLRSAELSCQVLGDGRYARAGRVMMVAWRLSSALEVTRTPHSVRILSNVCVIPRVADLMVRDDVDQPREDFRHLR